MKYLTGSGKTIALLRGQHVGRGGEGEVLPVAGAPELVAKIFHQPTIARRSKLVCMLANPLPQRGDRPWVAWPVDTLHRTGAEHRFAGYIMPRITHARSVFLAYNQTERSVKCPGIDYRHLVRSARNLASAVYLAHSRQCILGDLNESNLLVQPDGRVVLIDTDSWQIHDSVRRKNHRCPVCKPEFLPAELHGQKLDMVDREPWHDNFALAVLIFKLLMEGTHPFDGVYHGRGEPPAVAERIAAGDFPYVSPSGLWTPKPFAPVFSALHPELRHLFIQAFVTGHADPRRRPDARTWQVTFDRVEPQLRRCSRSASHWAWQTPCPWCERAALLGGLDPFPAGQASTTKRRRPRAVAVAKTATAGAKPAPQVPTKQAAAPVALPAPPAAPRASLWQLMPWLLLFAPLKHAAADAGLSAGQISPNTQNMERIIQLMDYVRQVFSRQASNVGHHPIDATAALTATAVVVSIGAALTLLLWVVHLMVRLAVTIVLGFAALIVITIRAFCKK